MAAFDTLLVSTRLRETGLTPEQANEITFILDSLITAERAGRITKGTGHDVRVWPPPPTKTDLVIFLLICNLVMTFMLLLVTK